jgi:2-oxoglutarate dehydrogenase E1 component
MDARTGLYCSDIARSIDSPVIHVNSEDADMVDAACKLAVRYR